MSTKKESLRFNYDGKWSSDFDITNISLNDGMFEEQFIANRTLVEHKVPRRAKPYFSHIEEEPLEFELGIAFNNTYDDVLIDRIVTWLYNGYYKPLYFEEYPNKIYYCQPVNDSKIIHNGFKMGHVTIKMRCDSPYVYGPVQETQIYDFSQLNGTGTFTIMNQGHLEALPRFTIEITDNTDFVISNKSDNRNTCYMEQLNKGETIMIDSDTEEVETNVTGRYIYSNHNDVFLKLVKGSNDFEIQGKGKIKVRYQMRYRF